MYPCNQMTQEIFNCQLSTLTRHVPTYPGSDPNIPSSKLLIDALRRMSEDGATHFVTSMTALVTSSWSTCRVGFATTEKRRLCTVHAQSGLGHLQLAVIKMSNRDRT